MDPLLHLCHPQQRRDQVVASADLSHPDVWSLEIMNGGYRKSHRSRLPECGGPPSLSVHPICANTLGGGGLICKAAVAVLFTLK